MRRLLAAAVSTGLVFSAASYSYGDVVVYSSYTTFNSLGTVIDAYDFEDVAFPSEDGYAFPPTPWEIHGVSYAGNPVVVLSTCPDYPPHPYSNVLGDVTGTIVASLLDTDHHMLALDAAVLLSGSMGSSSIVLRTNLNPVTGYTKPLSDLPPVSEAPRFFGFVTDTPSEYFTGFTVNYISPVQVVIDNVAFGTVPEPASLTLLATALLGIAGFTALRRRRLRAG